MSQISKLVKIIAIILCTVILAVLVYSHFHKKLQDEALLDFNNRARLIKTYLNLLGSNIHSFKQDIEYLYHLKPDYFTPHPRLRKLHNFDDTHYILLNDSENKLQGNLSGIGSVEQILPLYGKELSTVLELSSRFNSLVESLPEITWVYYTSVNRFIFMAPNAPPEEYLFSMADYKKNFWQEAQPENNPEHKQIITRLYNDAAGQGLMITISAPVILDNQFSGVISLDLGLKFLRSLLQSDIHSPLGENMLIDESHSLISKVDDFTIGTKITIPDAAYKSQGFYYSQKKHWLISEVATGELWLVHCFRNDKIMTSAIIKSIPVWIILIITLFLAFVLLKLQESNQHIIKLSRIDPLTSLLNRRGLYEAIKQPVSFSQRHKTPWSVIIMDIDYFKKVNDTYGHDVGDEVIKSIGQLLNDNIRDSDLAARWGGEEFLIFLPQTDIKKACCIAEKLLKSVARQRISNKKLTITLSSGCAEAQNNETFEQVVKRADIKLYQAKEDGRNQNHT